MKLETNLGEINLNPKIINDIILDINYWALDNPDFDYSILDIITYCIQNSLIESTNFDFVIGLDASILGTYKYDFSTWISSLPFILNNIKNLKSFEIQFPTRKTGKIFIFEYKNNTYAITTNCNKNSKIINIIERIGVNDLEKVFRSFKLLYIKFVKANFELQLSKYIKLLELI
ncbi:hypothetical protein [Psychrobacter sp. I-STPA10]|uniref:hypothetical protein n=1 Tax=Psychrobacter sp. I-STPA10 TaxID=2585769 RepID=UPI001E644D28|nr:hypothetical protein [Psychrobacter sp. I-STPA10]